MKKITAISLIVLISFQSCKKNGVEALVEDDYISGIIKDSASWVGNPATPDSILSSFRQFSSFDELNLLDFLRPGILSPSHEIPNFTPVHPRGQGDKGNCAGWTSGYYALTYYYNKINNLPYEFKNYISPDYIYNSLVEDKLINCNGGIELHVLRDALIRKGSCTIDNLPIERNKPEEVCSKLTKITSIHNSNAATHKIKDLLFYNHKNNTIAQCIDDYKKILDQNIPIIIGIRMDNYFGSKSYKGEIWNKMMADWRKDLHVMTLIGYDDNKNAFKVVNSWGKGWGEGGYGYIDYSFLFNPVVLHESFIIKLSKNEDPSEQTGVTFFTNYNKDICVGAAPNTGVFGGNMSGVTIVNWSGLNIARFTQQNHSRIEYNLNNTIPGYPDQINQEGTFEMTANIQNAYIYNNYQLENDSIATLFTTDNSGADVNWPGSMRLLASKSGTIQFVINTQKYGNAPNILEAKNTHFRFKQWHRIGVSYGSQGMHIMLDGKIVASNLNFKQKIANGGGHSLQNDRPTIGEAKSYFPWGNYQYGRGFEGYLYKVRSSAIQSDFKLSL